MSRYFLPVDCIKAAREVADAARSARELVHDEPRHESLTAVAHAFDMFAELIEEQSHGND